MKQKSLTEEEYKAISLGKILTARHCNRHLLQDQNRKLFTWFAEKLGSRKCVRETYDTSKKV